MARRAASSVLFVLLSTCLVLAQHRAGSPPQSGNSGAGVGSVPTKSGPTGSRDVPRGGIHTRDSLDPFSRDINSSPESIQVRVSYPDDRPVAEYISVELHNTSGATVAQGMTDPDGKVSFASVTPGSYYLRITGSGVKELTTDNFSLMHGERNHVEWVHVQRSEMGTTGSKEGTVAAADLNIPEKAKKEFRKGNEAFSAGNLKKAVEHYAKATEVYPRFALAFNNLGVVYVQNSDILRAREAFAKAIEINPGISSANANLARLDLRENKADDAIPLLSRGLASTPESVEMLAMMAQAKLMAHSYDEAIAYAAKTHRLSHQRFASVHVIAAEAYEAQKKPVEARAQYQLFLQEDPDSPLAAKIRSALGQTTAQQSLPDQAR